jgi:hypothetical protein
MYNDHGARNLCLQTGRWTGVDELAHKYWETSPFVSMLNNPMKYVDPTGKSAEIVYDHKNKTITISAHLIFYGTDAEKGRDGAMRQIKDVYKDTKVKLNGTEYVVKYNVSSEFIADEAKVKSMIEEDEGYINNFIRVEEVGPARRDLDNSYVSFVDETQKSGFWITEEMTAKESTTGAHELSHLFNVPHSEAGPENDITKSKEKAHHPRRASTYTAAFILSGNRVFREKPGEIYPQRKDITTFWDKVVGVERFGIGYTKAKYYEKVK